MMCLGFLLSCALLVLLSDGTSAGLAATWTSCQCRWNEWQTWSDCDDTCFGRRERSRSVNTICDKFTDCASNGMGWDYGDCNEQCYNGGNPSGNWWSPCTCQAGYYQDCCDMRVNCGAPASITNGQTSYTQTYYDYDVTYTCNQHYNMTGGDRVRTCQTNHAWSGSVPTCVFVNHCASGPCQNGATCEDLMGEYTCHCDQGWAGQHCENDVQPPVMTDCQADFYVNATKLTVTVNWTVPTFEDPMGNTIDVVANYPNPEFVFPWDDHTVQYVATKPSNGLSMECSFQIKVRPTPCNELNIPTNGARLCNGWQIEYGRFCFVTCEEGYTISPNYSYDTMYVCGASGQWIAPDPMPSCSIEVSIDDALVYHPSYTTYTYNTSSCQQTDTKSTLQNLYIERFVQHSNFADFCVRYPDECSANNVDVQC